jgi:hypothetical protein
MDRKGENMFKRLAGVVVLLTVCGTAAAEYGFESIDSLAPSAVAARDITIGDVSGDGRDDALVLAGGTDPSYRERLLVYLQDSNGTLAPPMALDYGGNEFDWDHKVRLADLDNDGDQDIVVTRGHFFSLLRNDGDMQFSSSQAEMTGETTEFDFLDVDSDGILDIVALNYWSGEITGAIYFGDGDSGISGSSALDIPGGTHLQLADMDADGRRDLVYLRHDRSAILIHSQQGTSFSADYVSIPMAFRWYSDTEGMAVADFDNDGEPEVAVQRMTGFQSKTFVYGRRQDGRYRIDSIRPSHFAARGLLALDIDRDGGMDVLQTPAGGAYIGLNFGTSAGLGPQHLFLAGGVGFQMRTAVGDLNGDGFLDVALSDYGQGVDYLRGRAIPRNADVGVSLGLTSTVAAVRLDNHGEFAESQPLELTLRLDARFGGVTAADVPDGCSADPWPGDITFRCAITTLPPGSNRTLLFPVTVPARSTPNHLTATASVETDPSDLRRDNNVASKRLVIIPSNIRRTSTPSAGRTITVPGMAASRGF